MEWLTQQAQSASPFIASFCLIALGVVIKVALVLWNQLKFEREQHREAEVSFAEASKDMAVSSAQLSQSVGHLTTTLNSVLPELIHIATGKRAPPR